MRLRSLGTCAVLLLASACAHKPVSERIAEHERTRVSWEQTVRAIGLEWSRHALPDAYAQRTLARAREELDREKKAVREDQLPPADRERLSTSVDSVLAFADAMEHALSSSDAAAARRLYDRMPAPNADSLRRLAELK